MWNSLSCPPSHCKLTVKLLCPFSNFCFQQHFSGLYLPHLENPPTATDFLGLFSSKKTVGYCATSIGFGVRQTWQATVCGVARVRHDLATELLPLKFTLEKEMATHSSILAWRIPWAEGPNELQSMGSQRVGHDWVTNTHTHLLKFQLSFYGLCNYGHISFLWASVSWSVNWQSALQGCCRAPSVMAE